MEWMQRFNEAIRYLEEHLTEEIDYGRLGKIACCSSYHFQRTCLAEKKRLLMWPQSTDIALPQHSTARFKASTALLRQRCGMRVYQSNPFLNLRFLL